MKIGLLGYGTIGRGVHKLIQGLEKKYNLELVNVFDLPIKKDVLGDLLVTNVDDIVNNPEIETIIEVLGGHDLPYQVIVKGLKNKKNVITANKEVVSMHLEEFINLAHENNVSFLFEASVGGGIPILRSLIDNVKINDVDHVYGILNGTTNYILTKMQEENLSFDEALKLAQKNGFAEADPTADLEGLDMVRKISILSSLAYSGNICNDDIKHYGIKGVNAKIIEDIKKRDYVLKFIAESKKSGSNVDIRVEPILVTKNHPLSTVRHEFNAVVFNGSSNDVLEFYGKGAGSLPTASAILADLISIIENRGYINYQNKNKLVINSKALENETYYMVLDNDLTCIKENVKESDLLNTKFHARVL